MYCKWADPRPQTQISIPHPFASFALNYLDISVVLLYRLHCSSCSCSSRRSPSCSCWSAMPRLEQVTADTTLTWVSHSCCFRLTWRVEQPWDSSRFLSTSYLASRYHLVMYIYRICFCSVPIISTSTWCSRTSIPAPSRSQCSATTCWSQSSTSEADLVLASSLL